MDRISLQEYLDALQIVEAYHTQIMEESQIVKLRLAGISITDFLSADKNLSVRLQRLLIEYQDTFGNRSVSDVLKDSFLRLRNAGKKSWDEFVRARAEYMEGMNKKK